MLPKDLLNLDAVLPKDFLNIDEPLGLLREIKAPSLAAIETRLPSVQVNLEGVAMEVASNTVPVPEGQSVDGQQLAAETWAAALRSGMSVADAAITRLARKLKAANLLTLIASILTLCGGTTLVALIAGEANKTANIVVASITLLSAVVTAVANFVRQSLTGNRADMLVQLQKDAGEAVGLALSLEIWVRTKPPRPPLDPAIIKRAQELVAALKVYLPTL